MTNHRSYENGFGLIEVLIAVGISSIMMLVIAASMSYQANGIHHLNHTLVASETEKLISAAISSSEVCKYAFGGQTFNANIVSSSTPQTVNAGTPIYSWYKSTPTVVTGPVIAQVSKPLNPSFSDLVV